VEIEARKVIKPFCFRGVFRLCFFSFVFLAVYRVSGGHGMPLYQPFQIILLLSIVALCIWFYGDLGNTDTEKVIKSICEAGRAGAWFSAGLSVLGTLIYIPSIVGDGKFAIAQILGAALVGPVYSLIIYYSFFFKNGGPSDKKQNPKVMYLLILVNVLVILLVMYLSSSNQ